MCVEDRKHSQIIREKIITHYKNFDKSMRLRHPQMKIVVISMQCPQSKMLLQMPCFFINNQFLQFLHCCFNFRKSGLRQYYSSYQSVKLGQNGSTEPILDSFILALHTPFGVSRVTCGATCRLLAPWNTRLLLQWPLHWWRVNGSTAREPSPCTPAATSSTWLDRPQVRYRFFLSFKCSLWPDWEPILPPFVACVQPNRPLSR